MPIRQQFNVYGRVQGVGFRYFTWRKACELGLTGTVRNLSDGSVIVIAEGDASQITALRQWLHHGPRSARVDELLEQPYQGQTPFSGFEIT
ncbi:acylphosphatase [Pasteurella testudinis DSM 23072]|uniref:acylphosphatase n=1 Tax=Pasteurella testudinis DSM 23072 TaxID=1122938 RepID=A0A1W1UCS0_9PAST|nr:acylphosphatase [Pasteurella testudinis]SMB78621.1 acylphosphatase [Pasteurella testudinis DSM 23072]SUB52535.1 acylphosphatase [Pasteurella testudinis]